MKKYIKVIVAAGFTAAIAATTAFSQPTNIITVDEFGVGTYNGTPLGWQTTLADPFSGMLTLSYNLPFPGVRGDVVLDEPPVPPSQHSDVLRFDGNGHLFFFSDWDLTDPPDSPADKGLPSSYITPTVFYTETGPEAGPNGLFGYVALGNNPGADTSPTPIANLYNFISDVPEPGILPLLACGLGILGFVQRRRKLSRV